MAIITEYGERKFIIDECSEMTCRICVVDEEGSGHIYINREDAEVAMMKLRSFITSPRCH